jgi:uncharacterized OB-fold protein
MATEPQKPKPPQPKPLPDREDIDTAAFWSGTDEGRLQVKQCGACRQFHWPPRLGCPHCGSGDLAWVAVAPQGEIYSWTVVHRSQTPGFEPEVPYAVVLVALTEAKGVRMVGNLVDCGLDRLMAGLPVEAVFTPSADGSVKLVNWRPAG